MTKLDGEIVRVSVEPGFTTTVTLLDGSVDSDIAPSQFLTCAPNTYVPGSRMLGDTGIKSQRQFE